MAGPGVGAEGQQHSQSACQSPARPGEEEDHPHPLHGEPRPASLLQLLPFLGSTLRGLSSPGSSPLTQPQLPLAACLTLPPGPLLLAVESPQEPKAQSFLFPSPVCLCWRWRGSRCCEPASGAMNMPVELFGFL